MTTAHDVIEMLRRHYLPEGKQPPGIFAPEIQAPDSSRRADLIWQGVTAATRNELVGHEVKVTRQDVLVELADPTKADAWQRYCDRWWLVVLHPALIEGLELPPSWGVMAPPSGRRTRQMTVLVQAPALKPVDKAPAYATIARWLHWRHHHLTVENQQLERLSQQLREANTELRGRAQAAGPPQDRLTETVDRIVRSLGGVDASGRVGDWRRQVDVDDVTAALRDLGTVYERARAVQWRMASALEAFRRATEPIRVEFLTEVAAAVEAIRKPSSEEAA